MGYSKIVNILIEAKARIDQQTTSASMTALMYASMHGHLEVVRLLVESGASLEIQNNDKLTAAVLAYRHNHLSVLRLLLDAKAKALGNEAGGLALGVWLQTIPGTSDASMVAYPPNIEEIRAAKQAADDAEQEEADVQEPSGTA